MAILLLGEVVALPPVCQGLRGPVKASLPLGNGPPSVGIDPRPAKRQETLMLIYKIFRRPEWDAFRAAGDTLGAPIDLADGYIHISTAAQVAETASKYFASESDLVLVALNAEALGPALKWEPSRGGALFPHLYRKLTLTDVVWDKSLPLGATGHIFPEGVW
jgi:uncharacterized protein (DUF952 family)